MNKSTHKCCCSCNDHSGPSALVYSCSGAADVGEIADRAVRRLDAANIAWMSCLAGIGGRVSGLVANATAAPMLVAVDGCPHDCAKKTLELAGFPDVRHVRVTNLGFKKGRAPAAEEAIAKVVAAVTAVISAKC